MHAAPHVPPSFTRSLWFLNGLALLVALGCQVLLEALWPLLSLEWLNGVPSSTQVVLVAGETSFWLVDALVRGLSFGLGALTAHVLAPAFRWRLTFSLVVVALLATSLAQFPRPATPTQVLLWGLAAPAGALLTSSLARAWRGVRP